MSANGENAKFIFSGGRIKLEGSETFVAEQIAKLEPLLSQLANRQIDSSVSPESTDTGSAAPENDSSDSRMPSSFTQGPNTDGTLESYPNVFALNGGKVTIIGNVPGGNVKSKKMFNIALLLAYGNVLNGDPKTAVEDIRANCLSHGCLDAKNFLRNLKRSSPSIFMLSGKSTSQTLELTHPGKQTAKEIADSINNPQK